MNDDPTLVRNQPALTTASGSSWLIVGALFTAISAATLFMLGQLPPSGLAAWAIVTIVILYVAMVIIRFTVHALKTRLRLIAICFLAIALISLGSVTAIAAVNWSAI